MSSHLIFFFTHSRHSSENSSYIKHICLYFSVMNVALGRPVNQSTNYNDDYGIDWTADKAIDNNICRAGDPDYEDPRCCSATVVAVGVKAFWRINLEEQFEVEKLEIFARNGKFGMSMFINCLGARIHSTML